MTVRTEVFQSSTASWESLCAEAADFASRIEREHLITISVAAAGGGDLLGLGANGVIVVWYWG